jgi:two-component system sensor histidine kinase/response regulator
MSLVLVVDDDGDQRELYMGLLEAEGHQAVGAPDGLAALELACQLRPALVLTDWRMPRMDGIELCKALRRNELLRNVRIILHSSSEVPEPWHADLCLLKQGDFPAIEAAVKALLAPSMNASVKGALGSPHARPCVPSVRM